MKRVGLGIAVAVALLAAAVGVGVWQSRPPAPVTQTQLVLRDRVTDLAGILSPEQEARIASQLAALEARTGHQFVVASVRSLHGELIETFSLDLARRSGIGRPIYNDGVVLLVAPNEHKVRIEVGLGLEKVLTDPRCSRIIQEQILPKFRAGNLPGGIEAGVTAIVAALG